MEIIPQKTNVLQSLSTAEVRDKPRVLGMGIDSVAVMAVYLGSLYAFYVVR